MCSSLTTELYNPKAVFTHAALLGQACPHCRKFPTAASRRSLGRVSVPVWPSALSGRLRIVALVGRCPANQLMRHRSIPPLSPKGHLAQGRCLPCGYAVLADVSVCCPPRRGRLPMYSSPVRHWNPKIPVRLACIRHAASVHPEPGSNSPLSINGAIFWLLLIACLFYFRVFSHSSI